jgi:tetratricopeptide (TPR) repeat protein
MTPAQRDTLHRLVFDYLRHGQNHRALALALLLASRGGDAVALRAVAVAFLAVGRPDRAIDILDRLEAEEAPAAARHLLRSRALHQLGEIEAARRAFRNYLDAPDRRAAA